jgi:16S rRNA (uracil1498-N3)-methyltransferase
MHRFFTKQPLTENLTVEDEHIIHQVIKVFRAKKGDKFCFFNPGGPDHIYTLESDSKKYIQFKLQEKWSITKDIEDTKKLTIFQAYPHKTEIIELIVQKLVEVGVEEIVFFRADRSQTIAISENKKTRIEKIAREALEQCGGNHPIRITYSEDSLGNILKNNSSLEHIVWNPRWEKTTPNFKKNIGFWVGPEWGWSDHEEETFRKSGVILWRFNKQILRLETAAIVGSGLLLYL